MVEKKSSFYEDYKVSIIFGGIGFVIILILIFALGMPLYKQLRTTSAELKVKRLELTQLETKLANLKKLKEKEAELKAQNQKVLDALPEDKDVARLFVQFENIATQNGLTISSVSETGGSGTTGTTKPIGTLNPITYSITSTAKDYNSLKSTLAKVETALRVLSLEKADVNQSGGSLSTTFSVTTYVRGTAK